jgi:putative endonuclease
MGSTSDELIERLRRHNSHQSGFTGKINDWKIVYSENFSNKSDAIKREKEIKNKKSRRYIENLISNA